MAMAGHSSSTNLEHRDHEPPSHDRLEDLAWAAFLIATGVIWLLPSQRVPQGTWLVATGVILLLLNAARYMRGQAISAFTTVLGVIALAGGLGDLAGVDLPLLALSLIAVGTVIVLKPLFPGQ